MILKLHSKGLNISQIARQLELDRKTVRKYLSAASAPSSSTEAVASRTTLIDPYVEYLHQRLCDFPALSATRLLREIRELGYLGSYATVTACLRTIRPRPNQRYEVRFETAPGEQAQADFALFKVSFEQSPAVFRRLYLFTMVLGHSRYLYGQFCTNQKMHTVIEQHVRAFQAFSGVPHQILYDRMKTAVIDEPEPGHINYNQQLLALLDYYGAVPRACRPYRAKTKGKIERAYRYIRQDFFLGSSFLNLEDLNQRLQRWLDEVANVRIHGTTRQQVQEAFEREQPSLQPLPLWPYRPILRLQRKISRDGMICYQGNYYSVPDGYRSPQVDIQITPRELLIVDHDQLIASHRLAGAGTKGQQILGPSHRKAPSSQRSQSAHEAFPRNFHQPLDLYQAIAERLSATTRKAS